MDSLGMQVTGKSKYLMDVWLEGIVINASHVFLDRNRTYALTVADDIPEYISISILEFSGGLQIGPGARFI